MKRLALSIVGGVVIPFLYTLIVGPLTVYIQNERLSELMGYPVRWPVILFDRFVPLSSFPFRERDETFLFLFIVLCNVLFYSLLTYILLWRFWKPRIQQHGAPPEPPRFVQPQ